MPKRTLKKNNRKRKKTKKRIRSKQLRKRKTKTKKNMRGGMPLIKTKKFVHNCEDYGYYNDYLKKFCNTLKDDNVNEYLKFNKLIDNNFQKNKHITNIIIPALLLDKDNKFGNVASGFSKLKSFVSKSKEGKQEGKKIAQCTKLTKIPKGCFNNCENLETVKFKNSLNDYRKNLLKYNKNKGFKNRSEFEKNINEDTKKKLFEKIGRSYYIRYIGSLIEKIGKNAFKDCNNLKNFSREKYNFEGIKNTNIYEDEKDDKNDFFLKGLFKLKEIGESAFEGCKAIEEINMAQTLIEKIGKNAFKGCKELKNFKNKYILTYSNLTYLTIERNEVFNNHSLRTIGEGAFENCENLESFDFTHLHWLRTIKLQAFKGCKKLKSIDLSVTQLETIEENTFSGCIALQKITLPETIKTIKNNAFKECVNLKEINIIKNEKNTTKIDNYIDKHGDYYGIKGTKDIIILGKELDGVFYKDNWKDLLKERVPKREPYLEHDNIDILILPYYILKDGEEESSECNHALKEYDTRQKNAEELASKQNAEKLASLCKYKKKSDEWKKLIKDENIDLKKKRIELLNSTRSKIKGDGDAPWVVNMQEFFTQRLTFAIERIKKTQIIIYPNAFPMNNNDNDIEVYEKKPTTDQTKIGTINNNIFTPSKD